MLRRLASFSVAALVLISAASARESASGAIAGQESARDPAHRPARGDRDGHQCRHQRAARRHIRTPKVALRSQPSLGDLHHIRVEAAPASPAPR